METITTTPFGRRPLTATLMKRAREARAPAPLPQVDKWEVLRALTRARAAFGVTDRDLVVLNALLSFHPGNTLSDNEGMIVFPSNRNLSDRAHGMAESTLRRHLAALCDAGLVQRHDSPNGKRYAARGQGGEIVRAFGFDLRPLLVRSAAIARAAAVAEAAADRLRRLREEVVVLKRDALKLAQYAQESGAAGDWTAFEARLLALHRALRRKLDEAEMEGLAIEARELLREAQNSLETGEMDGSDAENERHHLNSTTDSSDLEPCRERAGAPEPVTPRENPRLPLGLVLKACPDILTYSRDEVRHWHQLSALAALVRGMMGISAEAWETAQRTMGPETAAITVAAILQRVERVRSPGGYLRALTRKAEQGAFSPGPMIMALLSREGQGARAEC